MVGLFLSRSKGYVGTGEGVEEGIGVTGRTVTGGGVVVAGAVAVAGVGVGEAISLFHDTNSKGPRTPSRERRFAQASHRISETAFAKL